ncbi:31145_t:CDS:2, partial [Gigaspora margarita]
DFSLCEVHYNQLVISDFLRRILLDFNYAEISKNRQNKQKQTHIEHADIENNTCKISIQTDNKETSEIGVQTLDNMSYTFESYIHLLEAQLNIKINEIEDLKKQLEYAYDYVIESTGSQSKWYKKCNTTNIDNKKHNCPNCNEKLDILAILRAEFANEFTSINTASQLKPLVIKPYISVQEQNNNNYTFKSLGEEHLLSEQLKNFSNLACKRRIMFINETFRNNKPNSLLRPIPITAQEAAAAIDEKICKKKNL